MPTISVTDGVTIDPGFALRDDAPLAKAGWKQLLHATSDFLASLARPIDKVQVKSISLEGDFTSPDQLSSSLTSLVIGSGINCTLTLANHDDGALFEDDGFSPKIPVGSDEVWIGVGVEGSVTAQAGASADGLGVSVFGVSAADLSTYTRIPQSGGTFPNLAQVLATACGNFGVLADAASVRTQPAGTVRTSDVTGSVTVSVTAQMPFDLSALASANLPLNTSMSIEPSVTLLAKASVKLDGELIVRCYRLDAATCQLGVYRKAGAALRVSLQAGASLGGDFNGDDMIGPLLSKALPGVDVAAAGITGSRKAQLNAVLADAVDRSLTIAVNAGFASSRTQEAAVLYTVRLQEGDAARTDAALTAALRGDWTALTQLPNAERIRDLVRTSLSKKTTIKVNLLGFFTAASVSSYLKTCTFLVDSLGQLTITDQLTASTLRVVAMPYEADRDKLRRAITASFLATAVYQLVGAKLNMEMNVSQTYFDYEKKSDRSRMHANLLLIYALGLVPSGSLDSMLQDPRWLDHVAFTATVNYTNADLMRVFFSDPVQRTPWSTEALTAAARKTMRALIAPETPWDQARLEALTNDTMWNELGNFPAGNYGGSGILSPAIQQAATVVHGDWFVIRMWVSAIVDLGPVLARTLAAVDASTAADPRQDPVFLKARSDLAAKLGVVAKRSEAAFGAGWGESVMFALGGGHGTVSVDIEVSSATRHFERAAQA